MTKTTDAWLELLDKANVPVMRYNALDEVIDDPHLKSVNFFEWREHAQAGAYRSIRHPVGFSKTPADVRADARPVGADTRDILLELGFDEAEAEAIVADD